MKIRRYYGYDCDSIMGFNNGRYIDNEPIEVKSLDEAFERCKDALESNWMPIPGVTMKGHTIESTDNGMELTTGYYDNEGNEMSYEAWIEANENEEYGSYRYVYVTFEEVNE